MNGAFSDAEPYTLRVYPSEKATGSNLKSTPDYSEKNILTSWFGSTKGDQTLYTGYSGRSIDGESEGANSQRAVNYYSEWYGPVNESVQEYDTGKGTDVTPFVDAHDQVAYHMQNAIFLPQPANVEDRSEFVSMLKNLVYSYGAAYITYGHDMQSLNAGAAEGSPDYEKYYYDGEITQDAIAGFHAVCVAGWDDTKKAELFKNRRGKQPAGDGAFLIKNSWGEDGIGGDEKGFFWMSYETASLGLTGADNPTAYIMEEAADSYDRQYLNDATGFYDINTDLQKINGSFQASNTFTADGHDQLLKAVSLVTTGEEDHYDISITVDGNTSKILSGTEKYAGYYTKRLEEPILIKANSSFTLTETMYNDSGTVGFAYGYGAEKDGLAFSYTPDRTDMSQNGKYPCLRAFTVIPDGTGGSPQLVCRVPYNELYGKNGTSGSAGKNSLESGSRSAGHGVTEGSGRAATDYTAEAVDTGDLPRVYDLRQQGLITKVKDQTPYGSCWTFGTTAAVESSVLLNGGTENGVRFSYPRKVTLTSRDQTTFLTRDEQTKTVSATAKMDTEKAPSRKIFWTFTGDTGEDYITVLNTSSFADEDTGLFTFKKPGTVTVTAACDADINVKDSMTFTATAEGITGITLAETKLRLEKGSIGQVAATFTPEDAWDSTLLYTSDHPEIAYVDEHTGKITALSAGTATITVTGGSASATMTVRVYGSNNGSSGSDKDNVSGTKTGGNIFIPLNYAGKTKTLNGFMVPDYVEQGIWNKNADGSWSCKNGKGEDIRNSWAALYNPYADTAKGESPYSWFKFDEKGNMQTGWYTDSKGDTYYLNPISGGTMGAMQTGWVMIDGKWYYFDRTAANEGKLLKSGA